MEAGRELDALIAEKVMGIDPSDRPLRPGFHHGSATSDPLPYSTDIAAAWQVVEKLNIPHPANIDDDDPFPPLRINAVIRTREGKWMARLDAPAEMGSYYERSTYSDGLFAIADTPALAICLAALKAVGDQ